jgi:autotransporter-associated beta strand protein
VTIQGGGTFSGHVNGAITLDKVGNNTLLLTNTNNTTGNVAIRQGTINLRDNATLANVGFSRHQLWSPGLENGYLSAIDQPCKPRANINLRGADIVHRGELGRSPSDFGTVNAIQGHNLVQGFAGGERSGRYDIR